jgi:type III restriction enzyme
MQPPGKWRPRRHYLGPARMPAFDSAEDGEEMRCAEALDSLPQVKFWLRNVARHDDSFWLPTASDKFYPDFVAQLTDGRLLVAEYKGAHLASGDDSHEKRAIGRLWERRGGGLFIMVEKRLGDRDMRAQLRDAIGT